MKKYLIFILFIHFHLNSIVHYIDNFSCSNIVDELLNSIDKETAIVVITYNRPNYFRQVVKSLEQNPESQILPFFFFLDGGKGAAQKKNREIIENSRIKNKYIMIRREQLGCGRNIIDARRFIFDKCNFKRAIIFEDDMIVTPSYITITLNLNNWAQKNFLNIGIVQCWNSCFLTHNEKQKKLNCVTESFEHLWGYCIEKKNWDKIKQTLYEYESRFLINRDYRSRNHRAIRQWICNQLNKMSKFKNQKILENESLFQEIYENIKEDVVTLIERSDKKIFPVKIDYKRYFSHNNCGTGQDAVTAFSLFKSGLIKISTVVNRGLYIGKEGINFNTVIYERMRFNQMKLDIFVEDKSIQEFEVITRN